METGKTVWPFSRRSGSFFVYFKGPNQSGLRDGYTFCSAFELHLPRKKRNIKKGVHNVESVRYGRYTLYRRKQFRLSGNSGPIKLTVIQK